ncbi:DoxX family protein [Yunchengibacter salinarum]|uniref:DoxX family protein n=1 Tax=Yunchengibacter salinarum TaxID=3133399 RepID=UPI0035B61884
MTDTTTTAGAPRFDLQSRLSPLAPLSETLLRAGAGIFLMPHGAQKLFGWFGGHGLTTTGQFFESQLGFSHGLLAAFGAGMVEFFGGLMLAIGLLTRLAGAAITVMLLVAATIHLGNGFFWNAGGFEYPVLWAMIALHFTLKGGNRHSLDRRIGWAL